jgi:ADP-heptose:LPS heptosyltransferase
MPDVRKLILKCHLSPGDIAAMTASVYSLHKMHPGKFRVAVDTSCPAVWEYNPDVMSLEEANAEGGFETIQMHYNLIHQSNQRAVHFMDGYCDHLFHTLGVPVPLLTNRPMIYIAEQEKQWMSQVQEATGRPTKYWLVNAGMKSCFTTKLWPYFQELVERLQGMVQFVQVGKPEHIHTPLRGVIDLIGKTDDRQLIRLVHNAQGVVCGVTFLMHLAAGLQKPAVILAGGRESRQWNAYPLQIQWNSIGQLPCCALEGCWKSRTVKLYDGAEQDNEDKLCLNPVPTPVPSPRCMALVTAEQVAESILSFYEGGVLTF